MGKPIGPTFVCENDPVTTLEQPTGALRFMDGELQQEWQVIRYRTGGWATASTSSCVWRPVPRLTSQESEAR